MLYPDCNLRGYEWTLDLDFLGPKPTPEVPQVPPYNTDVITYVEDTFRTYFPNVPVINIFGNHEAHPCDVFESHFLANLRQDWLYTLAADLWSPWLPPETRPDILAGGMYSTEVTQGLVVIGINTMFCYNYN
ncbi:hypothetical protein B566_EDAN018928, partial [Ephemera danica]